MKTLMLLSSLAVAILGSGCSPIPMTRGVAREPHWQTASNVDCLVWNALPDPGDSVTWSGACSEGKAEGFGTKIFRYRDHGQWEEQRYVGEMKHGKNQGQGTQDDANGVRFDGDWMDGHRLRGTQIQADGIRYIGSFSDDKAAGVGTLVYPNGAHYDGDFVNGHFEGHGKFTYADGSYYSGDFKQGLPNGYGTLHRSDAQSISGSWTNGCLREGTRVAAAGVSKEKCGFR